MNVKRNQAARWSLLVCLGFLAAACTVGPNYKTPTTDVPAAFKEQPPPGVAPGDWKPAQPQDALQRGKWWEIFGDPQLNALEEQVSVSNQTLAQAEAQFRGARAAVREARAGLFPTVSAGASVTNSRSGAGRVSSTGTTGTTTVYQVPIDVSYEADVWGRVRRQIEANVATAQASAADVEAMRLSLQAELAADWFQLHGLDQQRQLLDSAIVGYQKTLQINVNRHNQGVSSGADVAQAETQLETTRAEAIDLGVARAQLEHAIAILTGKPPAELTIAVAPLGVSPPPIPLELPGELLQRRPDIAAAERRVAAANAQIGVATAAYYPSLTLSASGGFASSTLATLFSLPNRFWSIGPQLLATIFDAGRRRAVTAEAQAAYDANVAAYRESVLTAFQNVEDNLAELRILSEEATQQAAAVAAAERSLTLAQNRYNGGITSYLEVVTAENAALANERSAVDIASRRLIASVNLVKALGGGWKTDQLPAAGTLVAR
ncbi:MAG TPA: efflux transporter outer membrane subunit [Thermoanaerobaculia bacterium]|jgi:NodT family efflux transporter outer membrane factor (OMF) lipoprotein|nr:efflux transporter outer membrane subunit [Thermoanaerobaculia bacterium]